MIGLTKVTCNSFFPLSIFENLESYRRSSRIPALRGVAIRQAFFNVYLGPRCLQGTLGNTETRETRLRVGGTERKVSRQKLNVRWTKGEIGGRQGARKEDAVRRGDSGGNAEDVSGTQGRRVTTTVQKECLTSANLGRKRRGTHRGSRLAGRVRNIQGSGGGRTDGRTGNRKGEDYRPAGEKQEELV